MVYPGGKNGSGVYQKIINLMPKHETYIEPFLGGGAILRIKRPAPMASIGIDADAAPLALAPVVPGLRIIHADSIAWLAENHAELEKASTLVYCDPPYLMHTRSSQRPLYNVEMTDQQHVELLKIITRLKCMVMISGYYSDLYASELASWRCETFQAQTRGGHTSTEYVWLNFPDPVELHDYRFLGDTFREREVIKRKQKRWKARLMKMDPQERYAMLSVIEDLRSSTST